MQKQLNLKVKYRESFRPFAPSVLSENISEWFEHEIDSPYMMLVAYIKKDKRIKIFINKKNIGAGLSRNKGIKLSRGQFIAFLDSDDLWSRNKLKKQILFARFRQILFRFVRILLAFIVVFDFLYFLQML